MGLTDPIECLHQDRTALSEWEPYGTFGENEEPQFEKKRFKCNGCGIELTEGRSINS